MDIFHHEITRERTICQVVCKFPLHIVKVEDAKEVFYNMKDDRNAEDWFFVDQRQGTNDNNGKGSSSTYPHL